jgi:hypothetical protein
METKTIAVSERPYALPAEVNDAVSPREAYARLLQQLRDVDTELKEERGMRVKAEDRAWIAVVDCLCRHALTAEHGVPLSDGVESERLRSLVAEMWHEQEIEVLDPQGVALHVLPEGAFEVVASVEAAKGRPSGVVVETWRPAIRRGGRIVRTGQVVVSAAKTSETGE